MTQHCNWDNFGTTWWLRNDYQWSTPLPWGQHMAFPPLSTWSLLPKNETLVFLRAIIIDHLFSTQRLGCICGFVNFVVFQTTLLLFPVSTSRHLLQFVLSLSPVPHRSGRKCSLWGCDDTAPGPLSGHKLHLTSTPRTPPSPLRQLWDNLETALGLEQLG